MSHLNGLNLAFFNENVLLKVNIECGSSHTCHFQNTQRMGLVWYIGIHNNSGPTQYNLNMFENPSMVKQPPLIFKTFQPTLTWPQSWPILCCDIAQRNYKHDFQFSVSKNSFFEELLNN